MKQKIIKYFKKLFRILKKPEMEILPSNIAFNIILAIIPVLTIIALIASSFDISMDMVEKLIVKIMPSEVSATIIEAISGKGFDKTIGIYNIIALILASNGAYAIITASDTLYKTNNKDYIKKRVSSVVIISIIITLLLFLLIVPVFGENIINLMHKAKLLEKYIDEKRYSSAFVHDKIMFAKWGRNKISAMLWQKRIPQNIISEVLENIDTELYLSVLQDVIASKRREVKGKTGSLTALPIIETQAGDVSAFVPTNVISITDGQIFLETNLFNAGIRPAVNPGISVSRVGGAAQTKIMKKLSGGIRTALAQYRELAAFSQFASDLDDATRKQLDHGQKVTELLKQKQYAPMSVAQQSLVLFAAERGYLADVELSKIGSFEAALLAYVDRDHAPLMQEINQTGGYNDEIEGKLKGILDSFKATQSW